MKKVYVLLTTLLLCVCSLMAQAPERFSYQAVVRDASNHLITSASVSVRVSILQGSVTGNTIYSETQTAVTNANGLMTLEIGGGTNQTGTFSAINWGYGPYFLKTEIDPTGGANYSISSVQQLLSVPYALYSKEAGNGFSGDYNDLTNTPTIPAAQVNSDWNATTGVAEILNKPTIPAVPTNVSAFTNDAGYVTSAAIPTVPTNVSAFTNDAGYLTSEQQILSISNDTIFLTGNSFVKLPASATGFSGNYSDLVGAPNLATVATSGNYNDLTNTPTIPAAQVNADWNATSGVAQILNKPTIPAAQVNADWNATSGAAQILNKPTIPTVPTNVGDFENNVGYITMEQFNLMMNSMMTSMMNSVNARIDSMQAIIDSLQAHQPVMPTAAPAVTTAAVSGVTDMSATCGGNVTSNGGGVILERGLCWSKSANPTVSGNHIAVAGDMGSFTGTLTDLTSGTTYHVRAFATNALGTTYGEEYTFTTAAQLSPLGFRLGNSCVLNNGNCQNYWMTGVVDANNNTEGLFVTNNGVTPGYDNTKPTTVMTEILFQMPELDSIHVEFDLLCGGEACCDYLKAFLCPPFVIFEPESNAYSSASYSGNNAFNFAAFLEQTESQSNPYKINRTQGNTIHIRLNVANPSPGGQAKLVFLWRNDNSVGDEPGAVITHLIVCDPADAPAVLSVSTSPVTEILDVSAVCGGEVFYDDDAAVTARGVCWSTSHNPTLADNHTVDGAGIGAFSSQLTGLQPLTRYYVRAYAVGDGQTVYGQEVMFWTLSQIYAPDVYTSSVSNITSSSATCGGQLGYDGGAPVTASGVCWSTSPNPTLVGNHTVDNAVNSSFTSQLTGLSPYTTYYVRAYATNMAGTSYGDDVVFTTLAVIPAGDGQSCPGMASVTDYDNNVYNTVKIGAQCWLKENLRSTHYADGSVIPAPVAPMDNSANVAEYGYLYHWAAVMHNANSSTANPSGVQGICPAGWHVPSEAEWTQLTDYVASQPAYWCTNYNVQHIAKALSASTGWNSGSNNCAPGRDMGSNNTTGFSAMAAGEWVSNYNRGKGQYGHYWSTSMFDDYRAKVLSFMNWSEDVSVSNYDVNNKYSVRCVLASGANTATVTTAEVSSVTASTVTCGGTVLSDGGEPVTARGVCWTTSGIPTVDGNHLAAGNGTGAFSVLITNLTPTTTYYVRAYATNAIGTAYGEVKTFTTSYEIGLPAVTTGDVSNIHYTSAQCSGNVTSDSGDPVTARGLCWSTSLNPTLADAHTNNGAGVGSFSGLMVNLASGTTYHVRAYATNSVGTSYGNDVVFTTLTEGVLPTVTTVSVSDVTVSTAVCAGEVTADGGASVMYRGFYYGTSHNPTASDNTVTVGEGVGTFTAQLQNLQPNTTYYVRAYATNFVGTAYGEELSFTTEEIIELPHVITTAVTDIAENVAIAGGIVDDDGGAPITERGLCWSTTANPMSSDNHITVEGGVGSFTAQMSGLESYTTYYVRAYATNSVGTAYGNELTFTTKAVKPAGDGQPCLGNATVTDVDGNVYNTVQIGNQCWMKENLRTTHFADGKMLTGPYYAPNNDTTKVADYGYLYHWADAMKGANGSATNPYGVQGICPNGWHLPSDAEWTQLTDYVSAQQFYLCTAFTQNTIAKSLAANTGWISHTVLCSVGNNLEENNATGFSVMPAGEAVNYVTRLFGQSAYFWSATANENGDAWNRSMQYHSYSVNRSASYTSNNNSVRCVLGNGADLAKVLTGGVSDLTDVTALINGEVTTDGGAPVTERGFCWGILTNPNLDDAAYNHVAVDGGVGEFVAQLSGLNQNQRYYYRTYVINTLGLTYGDVQQFTTNFTKPAGDGLPCEGHATVTDIDGNVYNTVKLGNQCWMKENLRTTRFADGKEISADIFTNYATIPSRYAPDNNAANVAQYGYLYNLSAATHGAGSTTANPSGVQGVCPDGWHLPSMAEWEQLNNYLGTYPVYMSNHSNTDYVGKALASTTDWQLNSVAYTVGNDLSKNNVAGFSAMPSGYTVFDMYHGFGQVTIFWTATHGTGSGEYSYPLIRYNLHHLSSTNGYEDRGYAVRCVLGAGQNAATVNTLSVGQITTTSATCGGNVTADGGAEVTARGVCWSLNSNPTIADNHTTDGTGTGSFSSAITGLTSGHNYYVRAYATNSVGTTYGSEIMFTTPVSGSETPTLSTPVVTTAEVTNLKSESATCGGTVTNDGGATVYRRGVCWSTSPNPTFTDSHVQSGTGTGSFTVQMTGLTVGTTYYVRAYASNSVGTAYGEERTFSLQVPAGDGQACPDAATVTDYDGNVYNTVKIGNQCWTKENLRSTHYVDGQNIENLYAPHNNVSNVAQYGYLYTWDAVMRGAATSSANPSGVQGICPAGWHVPSDAEWTQLTDYVATQNAYLCSAANDATAKALAAETGWMAADNVCAVGINSEGNNLTGFTALPAGNQMSDGFGKYAYFWSTTANADNCWTRTILYHSYDVNRDDYPKNYKHSVRCVRGTGANAAMVTTTAASDITSVSATLGGNVVSDGGVAVTERGVCWSTNHAPTVEGSHMVVGTGLGIYSVQVSGLTPSTTYYARAYAINGMATVYGAEVAFTTTAALPTIPDGDGRPCVGAATVTDYDGNVYNTVRIGGQCWMKENLKSTHSADGAEITGKYAPNGNASQVSAYGYLYTWTTAMKGANSSLYNPSGVQGICPDGWHLPSEAEWTQLEDYLNSQSVYKCMNGSNNIAKALAAETGWNTAGGVCMVGNDLSENNSTGFSALPAGYFFNGSYLGYGAKATFWSATYPLGSYVRNLTLDYNSSHTHQTTASTDLAFSVRCVLGAAQSSEASVPSSGEACPGMATLTDYDGNVYNTVKIGEQCWMKENLRTSHYANGAEVSNRRMPAGDPANVAAYGYLYNWNEVMNSATATNADPSGVQGICPTGWHVPSAAEWSQLTDYLSGISAYGCGNMVNATAKSLASESDWAISYVGCAVGNDPLQNNLTGFTAMPAGTSSYSDFGHVAYFWSATSQGGSNAKNFALYSNQETPYQQDEYTGTGMSVRCVHGLGASVASVTTVAVSNLTDVTVTCGGNVTADGGAAVTERGICWGTSHNPTTTGGHTAAGDGMGEFSLSLGGLTPSTVYYVRAYAVNAMGTNYGAEVSFQTLSYSPYALDNDGQPCTAHPTVTDYDGNVYNTVQIGNQCWMKENLRVTHYANATAIPDGTNGAFPSRYNPYGNVSQVATYGLLYNWYAVMNGASSSNVSPSNVQGVCPTGWHVPSDVEWQQMIDYVRSQDAYLCGGSTSKYAKAFAANTLWNTSTTNCAVGNDLAQNNLTGFSALPAGYRNSGGGFSNTGTNAAFWTTSRNGSAAPLNRNIAYNYADVSRLTVDGGGALSVRCVLGAGASLPEVSTAAVSETTTTTAVCGGEVVADGGSAVTVRGICWSTSNNPTIADSRTSDGSGIGTFTSSLTGLSAGVTYYVRAYATNALGTNYGDVVTFTTGAPVDDGMPCPGVSTVQDFDGNYYNTVKIGNQCWLKENMKSLHFADGVAIPDGSLVAASSSDPFYYYPGNDATRAAQYGLLYNWSAALNNLEISNENPSGVQGICPNGWHVPSNAEWQQLIDYVNGMNAYQCNGQNGYIAKALSATTGWNSNSTTCTPGNNISQNNSIGFAALPAGNMFNMNTSLGNSANFWSTSLGRLSISDESAEVALNSTNSRDEGYSVRCIKNAQRSKPTIRTVEVNSVMSTTATVVSDLTYAGGDRITGRGVVWSTSSHPTLADNRIYQSGSMGELNSSLTNLEPNTTYYVRAYAMNDFFLAYGQELKFHTFPAGDLEPCPDAATVSDYDGNVYNTVKLGSQCWMRENLHSTHYADGSVISDYHYFMPNADYVNVYGYHYNWSTAMRGASETDANPSGVQGICPDGWHVPSSSEWQQLIEHLRSSPNYLSKGWSNAIAKGLASATQWSSSTVNNAVGANYSLNNITGFTAMPAGVYNGSAVVDIYQTARFWSTSIHSTAGTTTYLLSYDSPILNLSPFNPEFGASVRCVRGAGASVPTVNTTTVVRTGNSAARASGTITSNGGSAITERGFCWSKDPNPMVSDPADKHAVDVYSIDSTSIAAELSNLTESGYYVRAYATNGAGTGYGEEIFLPLNEIVVPKSGAESYTVAPSVSSFHVYDHAGSGANYDPMCDGTLELKVNNSLKAFKLDVTCNTEIAYDKLLIYEGSVSPNNLLAEVSGQNVTNGPIYSSGNQIVMRFMSDNSTHYSGFDVNVRVVAAVPLGDAQPCPGIPTVTDVDNHVYNTVKIGNQCWMKENLRTTHYADGTSIAAGNSASATVPYRYTPNVPSQFSEAGGLLYNWAAVMHGAGSSTTNPSGVQGICPDGWHVPSVAEWNQLTDYVSAHPVYLCNNNPGLIARSLAAGALWVYSGPCTPSESFSQNNLTGFSILPVGIYDGTVSGVGTSALFWSTNDNPSGSAFASYMYNSSLTFTTMDQNRAHGYSVRCVYGAGDNELPEVSTVEVVRTHANVARCTGHIDSEGGTPITEKGFCWSTSPNPTLTDASTLHISVESMTSDLYGVLNNLTGASYYVRAYATNSAGTAYGDDFHLMKNELVVPKTGTESYTVPSNKTSFHIYDHAGQYDGYDKNCSGSLVVTTSDASKALQMTVNAWLIAPQDKLYIYEGTSTTNLIAEVTGVTNFGPVRSAGNTVTLRFVSNDFSQSAGFDVAVEVVPQVPAGDALPCANTPTVTDVDGNVYNTVKIGNQCWMKENLRTTHYADGSIIPDTIPNGAASYIYAGRFNPNNDPARVESFGMLYNWQAVVHGEAHVVETAATAQGICPNGWHVPTAAEWTQLRTYLNSVAVYRCEGQTDALARALSSQTGWNWQMEYTDACQPSYYMVGNHNYSGFTAMPAGGRNINYFGFFSMASFWSRTTGSDILKAKTYTIYYNSSQLHEEEPDKSDAYSVRCLKDN